MSHQLALHTEGGLVPADLYSKLAEASTPDEVQSILTEAGVSLPEPEATAEDSMGEPSIDSAEGEISAEPGYDGEGEMPTGRRGDILSAIRKAKSSKPKEDEPEEEMA